jgi:Fic-DOC domain mobile mystery protein B
VSSGAGIAGWGEDPEGATPLDEEQRAGLIPAYIATRSELNEAEADNILAARLTWLRRATARGARRLRMEQLLDHVAVRDLHRDMYGEVWTWAGQFRQRDANIGIAFWKVPEAVSNLLADAEYWFAGPDSMPLDTAAARFHHKLVEIHPFPNGNGRHAREMTDLLLLAQDATPFTWGRANLVEVGDTRRAYIRALQAADFGDYAELEAFVRN